MSKNMKTFLFLKESLLGEQQHSKIQLWREDFSGLAKLQKKNAMQFENNVIIIFPLKK